MYPADMIQTELDLIELGERVLGRMQKYQRDLKWFRGLNWGRR